MPASSAGLQVICKILPKASALSWQEKQLLETQRCMYRHSISYVNSAIGLEEAGGAADHAVAIALGCCKVCWKRSSHGHHAPSRDIPMHSPISHHCPTMDPPAMHHPARSIPKHIPQAHPQQTPCRHPRTIPQPTPCTIPQRGTPRPHHAPPKNWLSPSLPTWGPLKAPLVGCLAHPRRSPSTNQPGGWGPLGDCLGGMWGEFSFSECSACCNATNCESTLTDDNAVNDVVAIMTSKITSIYRIEWCSNLRYAFAAGGRRVSWGTSHAASNCISCQHDALQSTAFSSTFTPRSEGSDFQIRCTKFG